MPSNGTSRRLHEEALRILDLDLPIEDWAQEEGIADEEILRRITEASDRKMAEKAANHGPEIMRLAEKSLLLQLLDQAWKEHLLQLDHLRQGINLRAYGQRDPLNEYKREAFDLFEGMLISLRESVTSVLSHLELRLAAAADAGVMPEREAPEMHETREDPALAGAGGGAAPAGPAPGGPNPSGNGAKPPKPLPVRNAPAGSIDPDDPNTWGKVPRNAPCPCGTGKKYKHCHGKVA